MSEKEKLLNLIRVSDTFFPIGSFAVSQGMEQVINENLVPKAKLGKAINVYLEKIWKNFDLQIFSHALKATKAADIKTLSKIDEICYSAKITEENRTAMTRMGHNMISASEFKQSSTGATYKNLIKQDKVRGTYPVVLAVVSHELGLNDLGAISLIYVNLMEVIASLVRMGHIDYIEAQRFLEENIKSINIVTAEICDFNQSFPMIDIASMRHEISPNRMFIS